MPSNWRHTNQETAVHSGRIFANPAERKNIDTEEGVTRWQTKKPQEADLGQRAFNVVEAGIATSATARRVRTYYAQALILFNVYGIPLSFGPYLEYYHTTILPTTPLWSLSLIVAIQILCIFAAPYPIWIIYHRWPKQRRIMIFTALLAVVGAQGSLIVCKNHLEIMLLQGLLMGCGLGALFTLGTLFLGSHYKFNLPMASWISASGGFAGALVYTATAWQLLRRDQWKAANAASLGISIATLLTAFFLAKHSERGNVQLEVHAPQSLRAIFVEKGALWFVLGYILIFFGLFIWPIYVLLILSHAPTLEWPDAGGWTLLAMFGSAFFSSPTCANVRFRKHLPPVTSFSAACLFAGVSILTPAWVPKFWFSIGWGAGYGISLGAILTLHIKVIAMFHPLGVVWHPDMPVRGAFMMALEGISAAAGLVMTAVLLESKGNGTKIVAIVAMVCMMLGGVMIAGVRWCRSQGRL
ncbi:Nn.00g044960.m01.CDS01 [Neocucurbitaria sp. VM-36]